MAAALKFHMLIRDMRMNLYGFYDTLQTAQATEEAIGHHTDNPIDRDSAIGKSAEAIMAELRPIKKSIPRLAKDLRTIQIMAANQAVNALYEAWDSEVITYQEVPYSYPLCPRATKES